MAEISVASGFSGGVPADPKVTAKVGAEVKSYCLLTCSPLSPRL